MGNKTHRSQNTLSHAFPSSLANPEGQDDGQAQTEKEQPSSRARRPSGQDQLAVLLISLGLAVFVLALGSQAGGMVELVFMIIVTFATLTINLLVAFNRVGEKGV